MKPIKEEITMAVTYLLIVSSVFGLAEYIRTRPNGYETPAQPKSKPYVQPMFSPLTEIIQQQAGRIPFQEMDSIRDEQDHGDSITIAISNGN